MLLLVLGGCLSGPSTGPAQSPTPNSIGTPTVSPTSSPPDSHEQAATQQDPEKTVWLHNEWNQSVTTHVRVIRQATGTTVHNESYILASGEKRDVYNTNSSNPDGIEEFTVIFSARDTTERITIETSTCYGDAFGTILEDGTIYLYYAIC